MFLRRKKEGFTLIETIVGVAVFVIISTGIYKSFALTTELARASRARQTAVILGNEQFEAIRNLSYDSVGVSGGIPNGSIPASQTINRSNINFTVMTTVRNIDDPFDGTLGGSPNDTSPGDYRLVEINVGCASCENFSNVILSGRVAPKNLETATTNGSLFINVFDALGQPVPNASTSVSNTYLSPPIYISDMTNANGVLQLVGAPPSNLHYRITVTKDGYSTERTYPVGGSPANPVKPDATVTARTVTQASFNIDRLSALNISAKAENCASIAGLPFTLNGAKLIGTNPNVLKYSSSFATGGDGTISVPNLEWDSYSALVGGSASYYLAGSISLMPVTLTPNSVQNLMLVTRVKNPNALLVTVKEAGTAQPITGATATLTKSGNTWVQTTGRGSQGQTNWSGGSGQATTTDLSKYFASDSVQINNPTGTIKLAQVLGQYVSSGWLESSTFDTGSASNFYTLGWNPLTQPSQAGSNSVRVQIATSDEESPAGWNYLGPDGTAGTYYTNSASTINAVHNGQRFLRYKIYLSTANQSYTPSITDISFTYTSTCMPSGQVLFDSLGIGTYKLVVSKTGYQTSTTNSLSVASGWQEKVITLSKQ